jgi:ABC-type sugar transport system ATPase subunit
MIDGELIKENGKILFSDGKYFKIVLSSEKARSAEDAAKIEGDKLKVRLGIRCEDINIGIQKLSENSFQLPVYAVLHEAESSVISFELENTFLHARTSQDEAFRRLRISDLLWLNFEQDRMFFYEKTMEISKS